MSHTVTKPVDSFDLGFSLASTFHLFFIFEKGLTDRIIKKKLCLKAHISYNMTAFGHPFLLSPFISEKL